MSPRREARAPALLWFGAALAACLSVALINGGGLTYFDTASYLAQGDTALTSLGIIPAPEPTGADGAGPGASVDDGQVVGSRSAIFSGLLAALNRFASLNLLVLLNSVLIFAAVLIPVRAARRSLGLVTPLAPLVAGPILLACLTSLPFYVAYLMPDMFAPVLILGIAALTGLGSGMTWPERLAVLVLGLAAVTSHPSHLLIAVAMVPVAFLGALVLRCPQWWLAPLLLVLMVAGGLAERVVFAAAVKSIKGAEVVYQPFLTVRVIADGPGYRFLEARCPDQTMPSCALFQALQRSDDPERLTASHIMFETTERLGSYRLLPAATQQAVADTQLDFFLAVLMDRPVDVVWAFLRNTGLQAGWFNSVTQTIPTAVSVESIYVMAPNAPDGFRAARLIETRAEFSRLDWPHRAIYALTCLGLIGLALWPGSGLTPGLRVFALVLVAGIAANAFVCGGISQPSDRYGARVAFLLPLGLGLLWMLQRKPGKDPGTEISQAQ